MRRNGVSSAFSSSKMAESRSNGFNNIKIETNGSTIKADHYKSSRHHKALNSGNYASMVKQSHSHVHSEPRSVPMTSYKANTVNLGQKHKHPDSAGSGLGEFRRTGTFVRPYENEGEFPSIIPGIGKVHTGRMHG